MSGPRQASDPCADKGQNPRFTTEDSGIYLKIFEGGV